MEHTKIPVEELETLKDLKDVKVVFDVGARADIEYFEMFPEAEFHLFEPNTTFFEELKAKVGDRKNVYLNNYGLGDVEGDFQYSSVLQAFAGGEAPIHNEDKVFKVKVLNDYIKEKKIKRLDFLKIDTEGYDYKVLIGGSDAVKMARYIQYEHWDNLEQFHTLLGNDFDMEYTGFRNVLCKRK